MKSRTLKLIRFLLAGIVLTGMVGLFAAFEPTEKPKRADGYFGIHFDFHARDKNENIGATTTTEMIDSIVDLVHPDWIQIDNKGHAGVSSYPTKVGYAAPGIVKDVLPIWVEVANRRHFSLCVHHSGIADDHANATHPDWAAIKADGTPHKRATSVFGLYADSLLIPQLREIANYGIDGVWIDGDCWSAVRDYSPKAIAAFNKETGILEVPKKPSDTGWYEFTQFHRQAYRNYLNHYVAEVKKTNPEFEICSNWAFTDHMPEKVCAPVDYISGDLEPDNSVNSARVSARYISQQGKPWDLMSWSFSGKNYKQKTATQLEREAALVIAQGGGFQAYYTQRRDASVKLDQMKVYADVAKFCRARQELCHRAVPVPQIALLYSTAAHYKQSGGVFARDFGNMKGILTALVESQQTVDLVGEHHLVGRMLQYPLIIVPEWEYLEPQFITELIEYVKAGGSLLLNGPKTAMLFQVEIGVKLDEWQKPDTIIYLENADKLTSFEGKRQNVKLDAKAKAYGKLYQSNSLSSASQLAASITKLGKGKIAATYFTMGRAYDEIPNDDARQFLNNIVRELFPIPLVEVIGTHDVDVCVMRNHGKLMVNLINTSGNHRTQPIIESISPTAEFTVSIRMEKKPAKITLEPSGKVLAYEYSLGKAIIKVPPIEIHEVIVVSE